MRIRIRYRQADLDLATLVVAALVWGILTALAM